MIEKFSNLAVNVLSAAMTTTATSCSLTDAFSFPASGSFRIKIDDEILIVTDAINAKDITTAEYASARALIAARGALTSTPKSDIVKGAVKIAEAYRALVRSFRSLLDKRYSDSIKLSKDAWVLS